MPSLISASSSFAENNLEPQFGQKRRPANSRVSPWDSNSVAGHTAKNVKAEPLSCRQSVQ
jgi:hypothetical protein